MITVALLDPGRLMAFSLGWADDQGSDVHFLDAKIIFTVILWQWLIKQVRLHYVICLAGSYLEIRAFSLIFKLHNIQTTAAPFTEQPLPLPHFPPRSHSYPLLSPWCPTQRFNSVESAFNGHKGPSWKNKVSENGLSWESGTSCICFLDL